MKKQDQQIKELKAKGKELKQLKKLDVQVTQNFTPIITRSEMRTIKLQNTKPHGMRSIKNDPEHIIELKNVSKVYISGRTKLKALNDVSFKIKRGEFIVIYGASGSGKSTLLHVMSGLDRTTEGDIVINDINIAALKTRELTTFRRNHIGFIFQSYNLLPELNAKDNVELGRALQIDGTRRGDIDEIFTNIGISDKTKAPITELSGGQLQRVSIARALSKKPDIIFADEPTGALDSESASRVLALFKEINKTLGTTIVLVTHDKSIASLADRILNVKDGAAKFRE